jgi:hypothetical protein
VTKEVNSYSNPTNNIQSTFNTNTRGTRMRAHEAFPSRFLKSVDAKDKPILATITNMKVEAVGQGSEQEHKPVLHTEETKPMVLNRTNFEALEDAFGDSNDWPGHKIRIYTTKTRFAGKPVDGLRIEPMSELFNDSIPL